MRDTAGVGLSLELRVASELGDEAHHTVDGGADAAVIHGIVEEDMPTGFEARPPMIPVGTNTVVRMVTVDEQHVHRGVRRLCDARVTHDEVHAPVEVVAR